MSDQIVPFTFDRLPVRGAVIQMSKSWQRMTADHDYAPIVLETLGQAAAATGLIAQSLKFDGSITMQIQSQGALQMLVMQCTSELEMRGMASVETPIKASGFDELIAKAHCAITVDNGERPYQGIVEMQPGSLTDSLTHYFDRSVQVPSLLALFADDQHAGGVLLQQLPGETIDADDWHRLGLMLGTLTAEEARDDDPVALIGKLFAEDDVRVYPARVVSFHCPCTTERVEEVLRMLGRDEAVEAVEEQGELEVRCEYCGERRQFDVVDIKRLFSDNVVEGSERVQ